MSVLFRNVQILDKKSSFYQQQKDILIENDIIKNIADHIDIQDDNVEIIEEKDLKISAGFVDLFSHFNDPGLEQKETLDTGAAAAAAGGYTKVFVLPNTKPVVDNKSYVEYIRNKSVHLPIQILPLGAATKQIEGKEIGEMFDMFQSGAFAFTDGLKPVQSSGLFLKILQYVKSFNGILIQQPFETSIGAHGLMNEGIISTQLGLPGLPAISEEIFIQRDIELLKYTESKLHITGVSTKRGADMIIQAKEEGLNITFSVTPHHLTYCDEEVTSYDSNFKFNPPLRTKEDRNALRQLVLENKVDAIASHHFPQHWDDKTIEFEYAKNGVISLQTAFAAVHTAIPELSGEQLADLFSNNVRSIFKLENGNIEIGGKADFSIFDLNGKTTLTKENNKSKSANSSFMDKELNGSIFGIYTKGKLVKN